MNYIEHVHEPERLLLIWQPTELPRTRYGVAELRRPADGGRVVFRYLAETPDFDAASERGFVVFPAFRKTEQTYDLGVLETFMRRLPPRSRGDYAQYLEQFRLRPETVASDMALLGCTCARLPSDGFSLIDPFEDVVAPCEALIRVAGFQYTSTISRDDLHIGDPATLQEEPDNPHDPFALAIYVDGVRIGHVARQQAVGLGRLARARAIDLTVERINGQPDNPNIYLFARIRPTAAQGMAAHR